MKQNVVLLFIVAILSATALGQEARGDFEDLTLTLTAIKSEVLPLEPVAFKVAVTNNSLRPVKVDGGLSFSTSSVGMEIKNPNGKTVAPNGLSHARARTIFRPKDLASGDSMICPRFLTSRSKGTSGRLAGIKLELPIRTEAVKRYFPTG